MQRKPINGVKWCIGCEKWVPVENFGLVHVDRKTPSLRSRCKVCDNEYSKSKQAQTGYRFRKYGTTKQECEEFLASYNNKCPICSKPIMLNLRQCSIDHNHATNTFRGVVCQKCNTLLGMADDNIAKLQKTIQYLLNHGS